MQVVRPGLHQLDTHAGQGPAQQPRHVHLRVADPGRDGALVEVVEEAHDDDLTFRLRQPGDEVGQGQQVFTFLVGFRRGQQLADGQVAVVVVADPSVEREPGPGLGGLECLEHLGLGQPQLAGQLAGGGRAAEGLVQLVGDPVQAEHLLLAANGTKLLLAGS